MTVFVIKIEFQEFSYCYLMYTLYIGASEFSSYKIELKIELRKITLHYELLTQEVLQKLLTRIRKRLNLKSKNKKFRFELLTRSLLILEIQFYPCSLPLERKLVYYFGHPDYHFVLISYSFQSFFSKQNVLATRNLEIKIKLFPFIENNG